MGICFIYLDHIIICWKSEEEHLTALIQVSDCLHKANIKLKLTKCEIFKAQIYYLGHVLPQEVMSPQPVKLDALKSMWPQEMLKTSDSS